MSKIYLPIDNINANACYYFMDSQTIRVYSNTLTTGNNSYTDYFINSHYLSREGIEYIEDISSIICIDPDNITNDYYYRNDLAHIFVVCFCILALLLFTFKVFARLFGRWLKI